MYVVAHVRSLSPAYIKRARREAKGREMKGQLPEEKRGRRSRIRSRGTANQSSSARGWFCSLSGRGKVSRVSDTYILDRVLLYYCRLKHEEKKREATKKGIQTRNKARISRCSARISFWRDKDEGKIYLRDLEDMSILAERQTAVSRKSQQGVHSLERNKKNFEFLSDFYCEKFSRNCVRNFLL